MTTDEKNRRTTLTALLNLGQDLNFLKDALSKLKWDSEEELITLQRTHLKAILDKYIAGQLNADDITEWANLVECREDIGYETRYEDLIKQIIFELANPEINYKLDNVRAKEYLKSLTS